MSNPLLAALQKKQGQLAKVEIVDDLEIHPLRFDEKQNQWNQVFTVFMLVNESDHGNAN